MKKWQEKKLDLFVKRIYNQAGLDSKRQQILDIPAANCA
jgi:hypothetical protein